MKSFVACFKDFIFAKSQHVSCDTSSEIAIVSAHSKHSNFSGDPLHTSQQTLRARETYLSHLLEPLNICSSWTTAPFLQALLQPLSISKKRLMSHALTTELLCAFQYAFPRLRLGLPAHVWASAS
jgi:hypothetical protein